MGLFGGGNSRSSTENNYEYELTNAAGNEGIVGSGNTVNTTNITTDGGAIQSNADVSMAALSSNNEATLAALEYSAHSQGLAYDFSSDAAHRAFDAIDQNSQIAYGFSSSVLDRALDESAEARSEALDAVMSSNNRIDEMFHAAGRETASEALAIIKPVAMILGGLIGGAVLLGVMRAR